jgi:hypothetical protein
MARKRTDIVKLQLRLPEALRRNLSQAAKSNRRSMNAEIVSRLDESFLRGNLAALMREHIENASTAAATKAAEQVVQQLRNRDSGKLGAVFEAAKEEGDKS